MKQIGYAVTATGLMLVLALAGCVTESKKPEAATPKPDAEKVLIGKWEGIGKKMTFVFNADHTFSFNNQDVGFDSKGNWTIENGTLAATIMEMTNLEGGKIDIVDPKPTVRGGPIAPGYLLLNSSGQEMVFRRVEVMELKKL